MLKLVINSPKGGVGKTTIATNAALLLASQGKKVLVLDLAGGLKMSKYIEDKKKENPDIYGSIGINKDFNEYDEIPSSVPKASFYDVMIADTDDYYKILVNP